MDTIIIQDLEVHYRVGVPEAERAEPQRLLLTLEMTTDFTTAAVSMRCQFRGSPYSRNRRQTAS